MNLKIYVSLMLILIGCNQKPSENDLNVVNVDSTILNEEVVVKANEVKDSILFISYERDAVLIPAAFVQYNDHLDSIGMFSVGHIMKVKILEKTYEKLPLDPDDTYCDYVNLLKLMVNKDTLLLSGENVWEITDFYNRLLMKTDTVNIIIAENFLMKPGDSDGLTGCAGFKYMFIENDNVYSYIMPRDNNDNLAKTTLLYDNDGINQTIKDVREQGDTVVLKVHEVYQEGSGSRDINVFWNGLKWVSFQSNEVSTYHE